jgi:hypothetical protein
VAALVAGRVAAAPVVRVGARAAAEASGVIVLDRDDLAAVAELVTERCRACDRSRIPIGGRMTGQAPSRASVRSRPRKNSGH